MHNPLHTKRHHTLRAAAACPGIDGFDRVADDEAHVPDVPGEGHGARGGGGGRARAGPAQLQRQAQGLVIRAPPPRPAARSAPAAPKDGPALPYSSRFQTSGKSASFSISSSRCSTRPLRSGSRRTCSREPQPRAERRRFTVWTTVDFVAEILQTFANRNVLHLCSKFIRSK